MSRRLPNLNALRAFEAAARHLSFSQAADELCVTQGAISRHVKALECYLGVPLFRRLTRAVELTEHGRDYLPVARDAFDRIEEASNRLRQAPKHQVLTISVLPTFAMRWLIPRLSRFTCANPHTEVRMITSIAPVSFAKEQVDLAIRVGSLPERPPVKGRPRIDLTMVDDWSSVHADMLMPDVLVPVCSPRLLADQPPPRTPRDLLRFNLLHMATRAHAWPDWFEALGEDGAPAQMGPAYGHFFMAMQAAIEGAGIALVPQALAQDDLDAGRLVQPLRQTAESAGSYYVLCRSHQRETPPIRPFREWLFLEREQRMIGAGAANAT